MKNTPNRTTSQMREFMELIVNKNLTTLEEDLEQMQAFQRWQVIERLMKYVLPTLSKNENQNENKGDMKIVVTYEELPHREAVQHS